MRFVPADNKSYTYEPTEAGEDLRRSRYAAYSSELVRLYSALKGCIREKVASLETKGIRKIALFGASETGEVVLSALADTQFDVLAVVDNDPEKQGKMFKGHGAVLLLWERLLREAFGPGNRAALTRRGECRTL